jgi:hypothetical protein
MREDPVKGLSPSPPPTPASTLQTALSALTSDRASAAVDTPVQSVNRDEAASSQAAEFAV